MTAAACRTSANPSPAPEDDLRGRLDAIEYMLQRIAQKLEAVDSIAERVDEINATLESAVAAVVAERRRVGS